MKNWFGRAAAAAAAPVLLLALGTGSAAGLTPGTAGTGQAAPTSAAVVQQWITVTAASHGTTYATLRVYRLSGARRILVFGPWTARVGYHGVARPGAKREGDGKTPSGTYGLSFFFGVLPNPGVYFPFRHAYTYDYWDDDESRCQVIPFTGPAVRASTSASKRPGS